MVNKVILIGRLGQDPELRTTNSGMAIANLRLATSERRKDAEGNWGEQTEWHTVIVFGRTAETVHQYCQKGRQLFIEGRIQTRKWQDKEGNNRYSTEIVANTVQFLGGRDSEGASPGGYRSSGGYEGGRSSSPAPAPAPAPASSDIDDIPF